MGYFSEDFLAFFRELDKNNNKIWFDRNRDRYEQAVKKPFKQLVEEMIVRIYGDNPDVLIGPGEAIFRINRDIRFSKDKTPYKTHMAAMISPGGRKAHRFPGFYFQIGKDGIRIYSGVHDIDKTSLEVIRRAIADNLHRFNKIISEKKFKTYFREIHGEKQKRLPPEFKESLKKQPLIANKEFYVWYDLDSKFITKNDLSEILMDVYFIAKPLLVFLTDALQVSKT